MYNFFKCFVNKRSKVSVGDTIQYLGETTMDRAGNALIHGDTYKVTSVEGAYCQLGYFSEPVLQSQTRLRKARSMATGPDYI